MLFSINTFKFKMVSLRTNLKHKRKLFWDRGIIYIVLNTKCYQTNRETYFHSKSLQRYKCGYYFFYKFEQNKKYLTCSTFFFGTSSSAVNSEAMASSVRSSHKQIRQSQSQIRYEQWYVGIATLELEQELRLFSKLERAYKSE